MNWEMGNPNLHSNDDDLDEDELDELENDEDEDDDDDDDLDEDELDEDDDALPDPIEKQHDDN